MPQGANSRVLHIITGLAMGGAEIMLYKILKAHQADFDCQVVSLTGDGAVADRIRGIGVPVRILNMSSALPNPLAVLHLVRWIQNIRPHLVQTWMYHADLVGGIAAWLAGDLPLVWGLHNSTLDTEQTKTTTRRIVEINARFSHWLPDRIISCSEKARDLHRSKGYDDSRVVVIPNGFDLQDFKPDPEARRWLRASLGLAPETHIIGHVARFNPQKDYPTLLSAAGLLQTMLQYQPLSAAVHFVLCGEGIDASNEELQGWIDAQGLQGILHLLGRRDDIARVMAGFDLGTLSSAYGEAFPNVIGEMMACEVPCVVTDVGDSDEMVGDTGRVVAVRSPQALADAWKEMLEMTEEKREQAGRAARERIESRFTMQEVAGRYAALYHAVLNIEANPDAEQVSRQP